MQLIKNSTYLVEKTSSSIYDKGNMKDNNTHNYVTALYSSFIERLLSTATPNFDGKNDNDERTNMTKESECKYKRIDRSLNTSN